MKSASHSIVLPVALVAMFGMSACGSETDSATTEPAAAPPEIAPQEDADDEDHENEDHENEDHENEDHDDEDHDDEDHDDDSGELGAHEHGTAELSVAWIGDEVAVELISPSFNVFGFEYEPTSDEDLAIETDRTAALTAPGVVTVNDEAGCTLPNPVATEVDRDGSHSEITTSWLFVCDHPDEVSQLDLSGLFAEFPAFDDIDAQWISESEQSAAELTPASTTLSLRG